MRREFATLLPALLAGSEPIPGECRTAEQCFPKQLAFHRAKSVQTDAGERRFAGKTHVEPLPDGIVEGGKCPAGDARIDDPAGSDARGAGTHLHNEIWLVREGRGESTRNGVARKMVAAGRRDLCRGR
jgi:hypothetical protein